MTKYFLGSAYSLKISVIIFLTFYMLCSPTRVNAEPAWQPDYTLTKKILHTKDG